MTSNGQSVKEHTYTHNRQKMAEKKYLMDFVFFYLRNEFVWRMFFRVKMPPDLPVARLTLTKHITIN